jgi:hypothetical protein
MNMGEVPGDGVSARFDSLSGLVLDVTTRPDSPVLDAFYAGYDQAFVLPDEKEDLEGFRACLELGQGAMRERLVKRYGPHREVVCVARDAAGGEVFGGMNFISHTVPGGYVASNLNYIFIGRDQRGGGRFRKLVAACEELASVLFEPPQRPVLTFFELNDPLLLDEDAYRTDSERAGLDQFDRLAIWSRVGAKIVDHDYVQPPLSAHQQAEHGLLYGVVGAGGLDAIPAGVLLAHLERFFGVSVLKGEDPWANPVAGPQLEALKVRAAQEDMIRLLDPAPSIESGRRLRAVGGGGPDGMRGVLRG